MFAVVRHPDIETLGVIPAAALEHQRARGWYRVSEYRAEPAAFHLPDYAGAFDDLDAEPEPVEVNLDDEVDQTPAEPDDDEEQEA